MKPGKTFASPAVIGTRRRGEGRLRTIGLAATVVASSFAPAALAQPPQPQPPTEVVPVLPPGGPAAPAPEGPSEPKTSPGAPLPETPDEPAAPAPADPAAQPAPADKPLQPAAPETAPEMLPEGQPAAQPAPAPEGEPATQPMGEPVAPDAPLKGVPVLPPSRSAPAPTGTETPEPGRGLTPREPRAAGDAPAPAVPVPSLEATRWKPFNGFVKGSALKHGPLGYMDLSLGLASGGGPVLNNVAINGGARFNPWLRTHLTAVGRPGNWNFSPSNWLQEGYLEAAGKGHLLGEKGLVYGMRVGKVQNLVFTQDPLSFFDETPAWRGNNLADVPGYGQFLPYVDWQSESGLGFRAAAAASVLGSGPGISPINGYLRLRSQTESGWVQELRGGYLTSRALASLSPLPQSPEVGVGYYVGRQWRGGLGVGLAVEQTFDQPFRVGGRFSMPTSAAGAALGNFLGRAQAGSPYVAAQLPLARLNLGEQLNTPPPGGQLVGTVTARRVYRAVSNVGPAQYPVNDEYVVSKQGETKGKGLVRVVTEGPRSLSGYGGLAAVDGDGSRANTEYTQDVVYSYYRIVPFSDTYLEGKVYDKDDPQKLIQNLKLSLKASGDEKPVLPSNGNFRVKAQVPTGKTKRVTLVATAPGYLEETFEANLSPGDTRQVEIPLRPLRSGLTGRVIDETTGKPAAEVEGVLTPEEGEPIVVLTTANGEFHVPQVAPGRYTFSTQAPSFYPESVEFTVGQGQTQRVDVKLHQRPAAFAGKLTNAAGQAVGGAPIQVTGGEINQQIVSLSDGSFGLNGLPAGTYRLSLTTAAGETLERTVTLTAGDIASVDIQVK